MLHVSLVQYFNSLFYYYLGGRAVLGLHFYAWTFSSYSELGPLLVVVYGLLTVVTSHRGGRALGTQAQEFYHAGLVAPKHMESFPIKG